MSRRGGSIDTGTIPRKAPSIDNRQSTIVGAAVIPAKAGIYSANLWK
jgi:hypothetical protein